jgi:hypothetical protein
MDGVSAGFVVGAADVVVGFNISLSMFSAGVGAELVSDGAVWARSIVAVEMRRAKLIHA